MVTLVEIVGWVISIIPFAVVVGLPAYGAYYLSKNLKLTALAGAIGFGAGTYLGIIPLGVVALVVLIASGVGFFMVRKRLVGAG
jgi:hypothetical protein